MQVISWTIARRINYGENGLKQEDLFMRPSGICLPPGTMTMVAARKYTIFHRFGNLSLLYLKTVPPDWRKPLITPIYREFALFRWIRILSRIWSCMWMIIQWKSWKKISGSRQNGWKIC